MELKFPMARWSLVCSPSRQHVDPLSNPRHVSAAVYSARYVSDRFLPDKAIDLVDEAASSLRLAQESKPDALEQLDRAVMTMQVELTSLRNESDPLSAERREALEQALDRSRKEAAALEERWQAGT
jgi:ATP-dependent Clp protease ATP-binding subunit ClpB